MNMNFHRKLPIPMEIKQQYPVSVAGKMALARTIEEEKAILSGASDKMLLIIGPCSADREDAFMEYIYRLKRVSEQVGDKLLIVPRLYTNKPRTTGEGYKGMLHQPDPTGAPDLLRGLVSIRKLHIRALEETGLGCADEMLYPENHRYLSDVIGYVTVGARSVEDQQHRLTASGLDVPVGMKNPTGGDLGVMMNAIRCAQSAHVFCYRGWEVDTLGNPYAHAILRGYVDAYGKSFPNYHYEDLESLAGCYFESGLENPSLIVDVNHSNSAKQYLEQPRIAKEILESYRRSDNIRRLLKGLMIESYLEDGSQRVGESDIYGKSITDPCLGWEKTERLIFEIRDAL